MCKKDDSRRRGATRHHSHLERGKKRKWSMLQYVKQVLLRFSVWDLIGLFWKEFSSDSGSIYTP